MSATDILTISVIKWYCWTYTSVDYNRTQIEWCEWQSFLVLLSCKPKDLLGSKCTIEKYIFSAWSQVYTVYKANVCIHTESSSECLLETWWAFWATFPGFINLDNGQLSKYCLFLILSSLSHPTTFCTCIRLRLNGSLVFPLSPVLCFIFFPCCIPGECSQFSLQLPNYFFNGVHT